MNHEQHQWLFGDTVLMMPAEGTKARQCMRFIDNVSTFASHTFIHVGVNARIVCCRTDGVLHSWI
jgi:hypothetical protein